MRGFIFGLAMSMIIVSCGIHVRQSGSTEHKIIHSIDTESIVKLCEHAEKPKKCVQAIIDILVEEGAE